jgi:hypothetical protein
MVEHRIKNPDTYISGFSKIPLGDKVTTSTRETHGPGLTHIEPVTLDGRFVDPGEFHEPVRIRAIYCNLFFTQAMSRNRAKIWDNTDGRKGFHSFFNTGIIFPKTNDKVGRDMIFPKHWHRFFQCRQDVIE